jgi:hypothetical protein
MVIAKTCKAEAISDSVRGEGLESNKSFVFDDAVCDMVWPITGANSYVCKTGKSMKAEELAVPICFFGTLAAVSLVLAVVGLISAEEN